MLECAAGFLADLDAAGMPAEALAGYLRGLEQADAVQAVARGRMLAAFDAQGGPAGDGQRTTRAWLVHSLRVTRGQAAKYKAVQALAQDHQPLMDGLREGHVITESVALQLAQWTRAIPGEFRAQAEEIVVAAARAGADLRALAAICAEIRYQRNCIVIDVTSASLSLLLSDTPALTDLERDSGGPDLPLMRGPAGGRCTPATGQPWQWRWLALSADRRGGNR
jgi:hypothetical protein